jgi:EAL domain-containing protein (putative c-di-GMP-specific phosphodiesterase class I)
VKVAVDDAGAGYSGLQHLVQMEPDIIKMDMSLTRGIHENAARRALASAMVHYCRETGSQMVAEGIETQQELLTLQALGIGRGQGYLLGRPGPLPAVGARLSA